MYEKKSFRVMSVKPLGALGGGGMSGATLTRENTSRFVQAGAVKVHYHEAGSGPVLLCIHGGAPGAFFVLPVERTGASATLLFFLPALGASATRTGAVSCLAFFLPFLSAIVIEFNLKRFWP